MPEEIANLKEHYGFKTLKKLLLGTEIFELVDEQISEGRFHTLYRNKLRP